MYVIDIEITHMINRLKARDHREFAFPWRLGVQCDHTNNPWHNEVFMTMHHKPHTQFQLKISWYTTKAFLMTFLSETARIRFSLWFLMCRTCILNIKWYGTRHMITHLWKFKAVCNIKSANCMTCLGTLLIISNLCGILYISEHVNYDPTCGRPFTICEYGAADGLSSVCVMTQIIGEHHVDALT